MSAMNWVKDLLKVTGIPVIIASLCCLAPIVLVALGVSTVAFGISLTNVLDGQYRWVFNIVGIAALIISTIYYFRKKGVCTLDHVKKRRNEIINKVLLFTISAGIIYYLFFNIFLTWVGRLLKLWG